MLSHIIAPLVGHFRSSLFYLLRQLSIDSFISTNQTQKETLILLSGSILRVLRTNPSLLKHLPACLEFIPFLPMPLSSLVSHLLSISPLWSSSKMFRVGFIKMTGAGSQSSSAWSLLRVCLRHSHSCHLALIVLQVCQQLKP